MLNVGTPELLLVAIVALVVLGPTRLPEVARKAGKAAGELRRFTANMQHEIEQAMHAPAEVAEAIVDPAPRRRPERTRPLVAS